MSKRLHFHQWLRRIGPYNVSKRLGVSVSTVSHWLHWYAIPNTRHLLAIKKASRGRVSVDEILEGYVRHQKTNKRTKK